MVSCCIRGAATFSLLIHVTLSCQPRSWLLLLLPSPPQLLTRARSPPKKRQVAKRVLGCSLFVSVCLHLHSWLKLQLFLFWAVLPFHLTWRTHCTAPAQPSEQVPRYVSCSSRNRAGLFFLFHIFTILVTYYSSIYHFVRVNLGEF